MHKIKTGGLRARLGRAAGLVWAVLAAPLAFAAEPLSVTLAATERVPYLGEALSGGGYVAELVTEALRSQGYTLFQAEWGMDRDGIYSVFAVVNNPADRWPEYSCYVIALGLLFHFWLKLMRYVKAQRPKREAA